MPWSLSKKEGRWCVIKDSDGSTAGCHDSRADAIKQQRALYANESRMASMYAELDALPVDDLVDVAQEVVQAEPTPQLSGLAAELVGLLLRDERERSLTASIAQSMETMSQQFARADEERRSLVAALAQIGQPVINIPAPEVSVNVPPAEITVEAPQVTVQPPDVHVAAPNITVTPEIVLPEREPRHITLERGPDGRLIGATDG